MCFRSRGLFLLLLVVPEVSAFGQKLIAPPDAKGKADRIFAEFNRTDSPGCAVGASIDDAPVLTGAYGMADLEHGIALTPASVFEPGSVTKQFTAAAVLLLAQQGKLSLDDPIRKYIPEVPDYGAPITIRHLLNHTSGLRDWGSIEAIAGWPRTTRVYTHANVLEIVARQRALNYPPGTDYSYTNTGYNLLAILVGRVSGISLPEFTRTAIFIPLGMDSTGWRDNFRRVVPNRAIAYRHAGGVFEQDMPFENVFGNGGLLTTVGDLLRWNRNFTERKVGGSALIEAQQKQARLTDGRTIAYAAGLVVTHWKGVSEVSHSGTTAGYSAWLGRYPEHGLSVAVLCNVTTNATSLAHQVAEIYLADLVHEDSVSVESADAIPEDKAGLYRSMRDGNTVLVDSQDRRRPRMEFETDPSGKVVRMRLPGLNEVTTFEKVQPANPSLADLQAMEGEYASDEAEVAFKVVVEQGQLLMLRRPDSRFALIPTYRDAFRCSLGSVRFLRDSTGRITEMSIGEPRVWDLRFRRVR